MSDAPVAMSSLADNLRSAVDKVMIVDGLQLGDRQQPSVAFKGRLTVDPGRAYDLLAPAFQRESLTLLLRREGAQDLAIGVPALKVPGKPNPLVNAVLFALTLLSVGCAGLVNGASYLQPGASSLGELRLTAPGAVSWASPSPLVSQDPAGARVRPLPGRPSAWNGCQPPLLHPFPFSPLGTMGAAIRLLAPPRTGASSSTSAWPGRWLVW
jgi:hypothetical protein